MWKLWKKIEYITRLSSFLQVSVVPSSMQCVMDRKEGIYKRTKKKLGMEVFTSGMKAFLQEKQKSVYRVLQKSINNNSTATIEAAHAAVTQQDAKTTLQF